MSEKKPTATEVTQAVIDGWKEKHGKVTRYKAHDKVAYFRTPTRKEAEAASVLAQDKKPVQSNEMLAKACFLGGDEEIIKEDKYFFGLSTHLQNLIDTVAGELTEL